MEISELDPKIKDTQEELIKHQEKTRKFKEYVQGLFINLYTQDEFNRFKLTTIKNVMRDDKNVGYLAITENANDIKAAIFRRPSLINPLSSFRIIFNILFKF